MPLGRKEQHKLTQLADRARDDEEWSAAVVLYRSVLARDPRNVALWVQYGHALKESGEHKDHTKLTQAEAAYRRALAYAPRVGDTHLQLAHVLKLQGRIEEARSAYLRAMALDPTSDSPRQELRALGWNEADGAALEGALSSLADVASPRRRRPSPIERADAARDSAQWGAAVRFYRTVLKRNPGNAGIWVQYGHALKEAGDLKDITSLAEAEAAYRHALVLAPGIADTYLQLGHVLKLQGRREEAEASYIRAFALDPGLEHPLRELSGLGWSNSAIAEIQPLTAKAQSPVTHYEPALQPNLISSGMHASGNAPLFSILVPVHTRTTEFREALDSVLAQQLTNWEVIIVTNSSPPETLAIIKEYVERDARISAFFYDDNTGNACRGRNRGIIEAKGEHISFLDSDDLFFPDTLINAEAAFRESGADVVAGRAQWIVDGSRIIGNMKTGDTNQPTAVNMAGLMRANPFMTCTVHVRRDVLLLHGGFRPEQRYLEDLELWLRLCYRGCTFYYSNKIFAQYRLHSGNTELTFIDETNNWYDEMWKNYTRPFENWGI